MTLDAGNSTYLEAVGRDLEVAARRYARARRRRRTQMRVAALTVTAVILVTGSALAGSTLLLGRQAPQIVQATIDSVWPGGDTSDLAPVKSAARLVARSDHAGLYRSPARSAGDVCFSIVPTTSGEACVRRIPDSDWPFGVIATVNGERQLVYGQIRIVAGATLVAHWKGGDAIEIPIGVDGFFLGDLPLARLDPGAEPVMATLRVMDGNGVVIASRNFFRATG